jgi:hypothetical protein
VRPPSPSVAGADGAGGADGAAALVEPDAAGWACAWDPAAASVTDRACSAGVGAAAAVPVLADSVLADPVLADPVLADPVLADSGLAAGAACALDRPLEACLSPDGPADVFALAAWPANASLSLRTTGASIVEDADRTNSPISPSLAMTALLSTPNSLASSYTRTFATTLPASARAIRASQPDRSGLLRPASVPAVHRRMLIERSLQSQPVSPASTKPASTTPISDSALPRQSALPADMSLAQQPSCPAITRPHNLAVEMAQARERIRPR